ncbi:HlyD family type I secretion periplasmic adaptor subunit [Paramagnetospirillum magneticum]|uniref:Membrane fusion protein (MFP) family protein n=1 Tax=Paramagnetospirillum magneticum (strain ATCC 700264 / AMB-1) TaxID=342108 RepID=Q2W4P3_PARM1|nr:HlyD family type I secretion periplasmic adaptor subunit [Paramagnetospirillum magneticum]BAE51182.1 Membrane-fusion protein [Paramagnetospirillum magneticum AMB-1]
MSTNSNPGQSLVNVPQPDKTPQAAATGKSLVKLSNRQSRHLAQALVLEESGTSGLIRFTMLLASTTTAAFVVWASFTDVPEIATAEGQIIPTGQVQAVQHLEGGIVQDILARDGDLVEAGAPIVRLNAAQAISDLEQTRAREATLLIKAERLRALAEERQPDFSNMPKGYDRLMSDNMAIFNSQSQARDTSRSVILSQMEQKRSDLRLLESQERSLREQLGPLQEEMTMRQELVAKGLVSRVVFLDTKRELSRVQGELARLIGQEVTAREALSEVENRLMDNKSSLQKSTMDDLGTTINELAQVQESIGRLEDRVARLEIIAPVRGLVKGLTVKNQGAVIQAGGNVCEVVPVETQMKVDAKINTKDVGHLKIGQPVRVKVTTYDFARYGAVDGTLTKISASSFADEKGNPFFKGVIDLKHNYVGLTPGRYGIQPGMSVTAEIITGDKTLLQYMLKPIFTQIQQSFHER